MMPVLRTRIPMLCSQIPGPSFVRPIPAQAAHPGRRLPLTEQDLCNPAAAKATIPAFAGMPMRETA